MTFFAKTKRDHFLVIQIYVADIIQCNYPCINSSQDYEQGI